MHTTFLSRAKSGAATPVIADVDTGIDDALALMFLLRSPRIDLKAVTCVAGNATVDQVLANTKAVLDCGAADPALPIGRGAERPLINPPRTAHAFHGSDGLGGIGLPKSERPTYDGNAVDLMKSAVESSSAPLTLLALGPLTNVALFIRSWPAIAGRLERIVFMGGAINGGNATPVAEFNAWHDPEALRVLLESGIPATMYGLDVFHKPLVAASTCRKLKDSPDTSTQLVGRLLSAYAQAQGPSAPASLGDAGAACLLADPTLATLETLSVNVELTGASRGQTIVDRRGRTGESEYHGQQASTSLVEVVTDVAAGRVVATYLEALEMRQAA